MMFRLTTHNRVDYVLDDEGFVVSRTNGPEGWDYKNGWRILGFLKRANSGLDLMVSLPDAANGADIGHGYVVDWDHGYTRVWMGGKHDRAWMIKRLAA